MATITRPTDNTPNWTSTGNTKTEPSGAKKIAGYANEEVPDYTNFNWLLYSMSTYIDWLTSFVDTHYHLETSTTINITKANVSTIQTLIDAEPKNLDASLTISFDESVALPDTVNFTGYRGKGGISIVSKSYSASLDHTTDVFTIAGGHDYADGDKIAFLSLPDTTLTESAKRQVMYVRDSDATTFKVSLTSGGGAVDFDTSGTVQCWHVVSEPASPDSHFSFLNCDCSISSNAALYNASNNVFWNFNNCTGKIFFEEGRIYNNSGSVEGIAIDASGCQNISTLDTEKMLGRCSIGWKITQNSKLELQTQEEGYTGISVTTPFYAETGGEIYGDGIEDAEVSAAVTGKINYTTSGSATKIAMNGKTITLT